MSKVERDPGGLAVTDAVAASGSQAGSVAPGVSGEGVARVTGGLSIRAPEFTGVELFARFKSDLDTYYTIHNFRDDLKLRFLPLCLKGVARDAFEALSEECRSTYDKAIAGLSKCFVKPCALDAHAKLRNLKFDASMSLDSFIIEFKHLMSVAFPGTITDQVLFHSFLPTLPVKYQEHILSLGLADFDDAVRGVRNLMRSERLQVPVRQVNTEADLLRQILERIESLERRVGREAVARSAGQARGGGSGRGRGTTPSTSVRACYCCGSTDHLRVACPSRDAYCGRCGRRGHTGEMCSPQGNESGAVGSQGDARRPASRQ